MRINDMEQLEYLHDAIVREMTYVYNNSSKDIRIVAVCDEDSGYPAWSGRTLIVTLSNVLRASGVLFGHVAGPDTVQSFSEDASVEMTQAVQELCKIGIAAPKSFLMLTLNSGSQIEIACNEIDVRVD